jgi:hypothetical protein
MLARLERGCAVQGRVSSRRTRQIGGDPEIEFLAHGPCSINSAAKAEEEKKIREGKDSFPET